MGCISLNAKQAQNVAKFVEYGDKDRTVWLHGHYNYVYVEIEDDKGHPTEARKFWENGAVTIETVDETL